MSSGLTRRRGGGGGSGSNGDNEDGDANRVRTPTPKAGPSRDSAPETSYESSENGHKIAFDPRDMSESAERSKQPKLTMMEEVLLLGLKDKQARGLLYLFQFAASNVP
jgi:Golgi phosphoprotein 3